jgi:ketosteroid isomerase-like protein
MSEESTTPDLVERTRAIFEAMDRDWDIDALEANWAPDIVWDMSVSVLGTLHGRAAVREFLESWRATWEEHHHHIEEIRDYGYGVVFIALLEDGRPVGSEGRVQAQNVMVREWVDGKTVRITSYTDIDEARAAAERLAEERADA